ncbi:MAG: phage virion morphogenesis protein [Proteobacteria bacterium]|nr:phage virion morphogenesis protein [Pseudomonadota bacterium]
MNDLAALESFAADILGAMEPAARTELAKRIARDLRASQQKRIAEQQNPDGSAYLPRKSQLRKKKGALRRKPMFSKLRTARYLKAKGTAESAVVAFTAAVSRIARVHQFGLRDRVNLAGLEFDYPARELLGISPTDEALIRDLAVAHLADRL